MKTKRFARLRVSVFTLTAVATAALGVGGGVPAAVGAPIMRADATQITLQGR
ncbi:hypothetical protein ACWEP5_19585 [Nocardia niigatensis]